MAMSFTRITLFRKLFLENLNVVLPISPGPGTRLDVPGPFNPENEALSRVVCKTDHIEYINVGNTDLVVDGPASSAVASFVRDSGARV